MSGDGKQHATSLDADQTQNRDKDHTTSHPGKTSDQEEKKRQAAKKVKVSEHQGSPKASGEQSMQQHERKHQCKVCDKYFRSPSDLKRHILMHAGEKVHKCKVCDKYFTESGSLTKHMRIHSGEKPFKCKVCDKCFTDSGSLIKHMRIHSGEKPFKCKV